MGEEARVMSTDIQSIVNAVRALNPEQRRQLAAALASIDADPAVSISRANLVQAVRGKYKHVPTSSEAFILRKAEDSALESRT